MNVSRIYRLLRVVTLLQSGRSYTANQLADELEVSRRTVFRDLNALEMARIPYYFDQETQGYRISNHFFLQPVNLTLGEALALLTLAGRFKNDANVPLLNQWVQAAAKLESILPPSIREHVGSVLQSLSVTLTPMASHDGADKHFDMLNGAIVDRRVCRVVYDSFHEGKEVAMELYPLRQVFIHRAWYLLAWSKQYDESRTFKLIRIRDLEVLDEGFDESYARRLDDYFGKAWSMIPEGTVYDVHLRFEPKVAGNVAEVQWHSSQRVEWNDDKSLDFHAEVDGLSEISWWILGYGDQVQVLSPQPLAQRVADVAKRVWTKYQGKA